MEKVKVFVSGCTDKLGHRIVDLVNQHPYWEVCGGFGRKKNQYKFPVFDANTDLEQAKKFFGSEKPNLIFNVPTSKVAKNASFDFAFNFKVPSVIETSNSLVARMKFMLHLYDVTTILEHIQLPLHVMEKYRSILTESLQKICLLKVP